MRRKNNLIKRRKNLNIFPIGMKNIDNKNKNKITV